MSHDHETYLEQFHNHEFYPEHGGTPYPEPWDMDLSTATPGIQRPMPPQAPQEPVDPFRGQVPQPQMIVNARRPMTPPVGGPVGQPPVTGFRSPLESLLKNTPLPDHLQELLAGIEAAKKSDV